MALIRELMMQIAAGWNAYRGRVRVDKNEPIYNMVTLQLPDALQVHVADYDSIMLQGSTGAGNITSSPWVALFDRRLTTSATSGYYVVYLFSTDLSTVTLSLAFGTTQFEEQFGGPSKSFPRMRLAATRLQEMFSHLIPDTLVRSSIDLKAEPHQRLHYSYQQASIVSYAPYRIDALPGEAALVADLRALVQIYTQIVSDPLAATVERLVEAVMEPAARVETIEVHDFAPRDFTADQAPGHSTKQVRRYSAVSRKVGDAGERLVLRYERERLIGLGRQDLADRVRWHAQEREWCGWDITSFDENGDELLIEVKSSVGRAVSCISLTVNEWEAACIPDRGDRYYIYIVTSALSARPRSND